MRITKIFLLEATGLFINSKNMPNIGILFVLVANFNTTITYYSTKVRKFLTLLKTILQITSRKGLMLLFWRFIFI